MIATGIVIHRCNPALMGARAKLRHKDTKTFDKVFQNLYTPLQVLQPVVAGLDLRFGWSSMPGAAVYWGVPLMLLSMGWIAWVMAVNPFAEPSVRIQKERGQRVISRGPYRFMRHPMYTGMLVLYPASAVVLGSVWVLAMGGLMGVLLLVRTGLEDRTLKAELPGYRDYAAATRYRLIPGLW